MKKGKAIVIGASIGGLMASKVLSAHFDEVILFERDELSEDPKFRKGVSQAMHAHLIYTRGFEIIENYYPDTRKLLKEKETSFKDFGRVHWMQYKMWKSTGDFDVPSAFFLRYYLDWALLHQLRNVDNVVIKDNVEVSGLKYDSKKNEIKGVFVGSELYEADLVVDTSGKNSRLQEWMKEFGIKLPKTDVLEVSIKYVSRVYEKPEGMDIPDIIISPDLPRSKRYALLLNVNGGLLVTLTGIMHDHPPTDEEGFLRFATEMDSPIVGEFMERLKPSTKLFTYGYPRTRRIRYDKMRKLPKGILPFADSYCSFNPIYGQGMTIAAVEANVLDDVLRKGKKKIAKEFYKKTNPYVSFAWGLSYSDMLRIPESKGKRTFSTRFMNWYIKRVQKASVNPKVYKAFLQAMVMSKPPSSLFSPMFVFRVFLTRLFNRSDKAPDFKKVLEKIEKIPAQ